jgi:hypothetical protein
MMLPALIIFAFIGPNLLRYQLWLRWRFTVPQTHFFGFLQVARLTGEVRGTIKNGLGLG